MKFTYNDYYVLKRKLTHFIRFAAEQSPCETIFVHLPIHLIDHGISDNGSTGAGCQEIGRGCCE